MQGRVTTESFIMSKLSNYSERVAERGSKRVRAGARERGSCTSRNASRRDVCYNSPLSSSM